MNISANTILAPFYFIFKKIFKIIFREREGEREGEKDQCVVASGAPPTGDLARNPRMCPRLGIEPITLWFTGQHPNH